MGEEPRNQGKGNVLNLGIDFWRNWLMSKTINMYIPRAKTRGQTKGKTVAKKKAKKRTRRKSDKPIKDVLISLKVTEDEKEEMLLKAERYAGGNLSRWLRYAAIACKTKVPA